MNMIPFESQINYEQVYKDIAGGGLPLKYYRRLPSHRGYGLFSLVRRFAFPLLKHLGRQALPIGQEILGDIIPGVKQAKEHLKTRAVRALNDLGEKIQKGVGRKKRRRRTQTKKTKKSMTRKRRTKTKSKSLVKIVGSGRRRGGRKTKSKKRKSTKSKRSSKAFDIFK